MGVLLLAVTLASMVLLAAPLWGCSGDSTEEEAAGLTAAGAVTARASRQHLPNVVLTTHEGETVRFYDDLIKGKIVAINFMYATCEER
jgi:protein SCO1/2